MKVLYKKIEECGRKCPYYRYIRCYGNDCSHPDSPETDSGRGDELLAENKNGDFPKWCPLKEFDVMEMIVLKEKEK